MKPSRKGFTLIELMVVVLIIGILAGVGVPQYLKTVETSKATDAVGIGQMLSNSYRMFKVDYPDVNLSGAVTDSCNSGNCQTSDTSACRLVRCKYVAAQDWGTGMGGQSNYVFQVGGSCGSGIAACARRNGGNVPYSGWQYSFRMDGRCDAIGTGVPACPKF